MSGAILVTGATGKTGRRVVGRLLADGQAPRGAARTPGNATSRFEWSDPSTFAAAAEGVRAAYLLAPSGVLDLLPAMRPFIDHLLSRGIGRLVLLSASSLEPGGPMMGQVHAYLARQAPRWTVLRPSWFMENFSEQQHRPTIRDEHAIYSAAGDGRVGFVSADDIAAVAARLLVDDASANGDLVLTGPEALSYDEIARTIGDSVGRPIEHRRLTGAALARRWEAQGLPPDYANLLAAMDDGVARGDEDRVTDAVLRVTGRDPISFARFASDAAASWRT